MLLLTRTHLGAMGVDAGTSGAVYFDEFESRRSTYIRPMEDPGIPDPEPPIPDGWLEASYSYDGDAPHAVYSVARQQYIGDENPSIDTYTGVHPELTEGTATAT